MLNLNSTIDLDFKQFFRWWKRELGFLVPEKIKQFVNDKQGFIIVSPKSNQLVLTYIRDGQIEPWRRWIEELETLHFRASMKKMNAWLKPM